MAEETTPDSPKSIKMEATSHDQSKVVQISYAEAEKFNLTIEQVQNLQITVARLESSS